MEFDLGRSITPKNRRWMGFAAFVLIVHVIIRAKYPEFTPPYAGKATWIRLGLKGELCFHILFFGVILNSIFVLFPRLNQPSDDGTLSLMGNHPPPTARFVWVTVGLLLLECAVYLGLWGWIYRIIA